MPIIVPAIFHGSYDLITVQGHADARGSDEYNGRLSERRAHAVLVQLRALGVNCQVVVEAFGKSRPLCYDMTEECHAQNRRVVVKTKKEVSLAR